MTLKECYEELQGDYDEAMSIFLSERMTEKFMLRFLGDETFQDLKKAVEEKNSQETFRSVHTLKGVAANLGFTGLKNAASALTEQLRGTDELADPALYEIVKDMYELVISTLKKYQNEKA